MTPKSALPTLLAHRVDWTTTPIGRGAYAITYEASNPKFIRKICNRCDIGYQSYVEWLKYYRVDEKFTFFPRIITKHGGDNCPLVVKMERLESLAKHSQHYGSSWESSVDEMHTDLLHTMDTQQVPLRAYTSNYYGFLANDDDKAGWLRFLIAVADDEIPDLDKCAADIHGSNIMVRVLADGSRRLVLTDPFSAW